MFGFGKKAEGNEDTGLRNRKSATEVVADGKEAVEQSKKALLERKKSMTEEEVRVEKAISALSGKAPPVVAKYLKMAAPVLAWIFVLGEAAFPYFIKFCKLCYAIYLWLPVDIFTALVGLVICFFGGMFPTLIAAAQAFTQSGWETTKRDLQVLWHESEVILEQSKKDDEKDEDGDGIPDALQISDDEYYKRKLKLFLTKCDPGKIDGALGGLYTSWLAVAAVLKMQFAKVIALAVSIGDKLRPIATKFLTPVLVHVLPGDYHGWIVVIINWICKAVAISIAWYIQRVLSAVHSGIAGGLICTRGILTWVCTKPRVRKLLHIPESFSHEDTYIDEILGWTLAACGIWFQIARNFTLPFPWNVVLLPFSVTETYIEWQITEM